MHVWTMKLEMSHFYFLFITEAIHEESLPEESLPEGQVVLVHTASKSTIFLKEYHPLNLPTFFAILGS